jgi:hypothetical protein
LRIDIVKGERVLVLEDLLARDFAAQDAGENIVGIVGHQATSTLQPGMPPAGASS